MGSKTVAWKSYPHENNIRHKYTTVEIYTFRDLNCGDCSDYGLLLCDIKDFCMWIACPVHYFFSAGLGSVPSPPQVDSSDLAYCLHNLTASSPWPLQLWRRTQDVFRNIDDDLQTYTLPHFRILQSESSNTVSDIHIIILTKSFGTTRNLHYVSNREANKILLRKEKVRGRISK
jgi:hypothetical protein